jgi:endonuclease/exonuclease/phosphatase family metal-dependent hydrolase
VEDDAKSLQPRAPGHLQPRLDHIFVRGLGWKEAQAKWILPGTLAGTRGTVSLSDHAGVSVELNLGWEDLPYSA